MEGINSFIISLKFILVTKDVQKSPAPRCFFLFETINFKGMFCTWVSVAKNNGDVSAKPIYERYFYILQIFLGEMLYLPPMLTNYQYLSSTIMP